MRPSKPTQRPVGLLLFYDYRCKDNCCWFCYSIHSPLAPERLRDYLCQHGQVTTIRASRGEDIFAAFGMLSSMKQADREVHH